LDKLKYALSPLTSPLFITSIRDTILSFWLFVKREIAFFTCCHEFVNNPCCMESREIERANIEAARIAAVIISARPNIIEL
jgi:hypothetical protein